MSITGILHWTGTPSFRNITALLNSKICIQIPSSDLFLNNQKVKKYCWSVKVAKT